MYHCYRYGEVSRVYCSHEIYGHRVGDRKGEALAKLLERIGARRERVKVKIRERVLGRQ